MTEKEIAIRFIKAHGSAPESIEECNKLIDDRTWMENKYPDGKYTQALISYVEDLKRLFFEIEAARKTVEEKIREEYI